jgi:hypothetical protein
MALAADPTPPCTTIAALVASLSAELPTLFHHLWLVGDAAGRSGRARCASDGVQLPSNARQAWRGTKTDLPQQAPQRPAAVAPLVATPCANEARAAPGRLREAAERQMQTLQAALETSADFLATPAAKLGTSGPPQPSHIPDQEAAKRPTSHGVLQG